MSEIVEVIDTKTGEVTETALVSAKPVGMRAIVKEQDLPLLDVMETLDNLDWRNLRPHQTALLLMQKPLSVSGGGSTYLTFRQAILFATRCYELNLSPFSDNVWFDPGRGATNITLSGKRELARLRGIEMGPPSFEEVYRDWKDVPRVTEAGEAARKAGFARDVGCTCTMRIGPAANKENVVYTAWINDWYVSRSPVWQNKPSHMLAVRANEKALTLVTGIGASAMSDEKELE